MPAFEHTSGSSHQPAEDHLVDRMLRCLNYYDYDLTWWSLDGDGPRVPRADYEGTVAGAPQQVIRQQALLAEYPFLQENFKWIDPEFLLPLIPHSTEGAGPRNGRLEPLASQLTEGYIAESAPRRCAKGKTLLHSAFTVPKKDPNFLRFILSGKSINLLLKDYAMPACHFPSYTEVVERILKHQVFSQFDLKSYFFQFALDERIRDLFRFRAGTKMMRMIRLPMGYTASPQLGQSVTEALAREACHSFVTEVDSVVWLDNLIFSGSPDTVTEIGSRFRAVCEHFEVTIGETSPATHYGEALGLQFDCTSKAWRMDPAWVQKINSAMSSISLETNLPLRGWWRLGGLILWRSHAMQEPLYQLEHLLRWMSEVCKGADPEDMKVRAFWEETHGPSAEVRGLLREQLGLLSQNLWKPWSPMPARVVEAHTDASLTAWAYTSEARTQWGWFPQHLKTATIDVKEMYALVEFIITECERTQEPTHLRIGVDNTVAIGCWRKAFSFNPDTLSLILIARRVMEQTATVVTVYYVPTNLNEADRYTRISAPHPFFQQLPRTEMLRSSHQVHIRTTPRRPNTT